MNRTVKKPPLNRSFCHGHTNHELGQSTDDGAMSDGLRAIELEVTRLETQEVGRDEARNLRSWERHKSMMTKM